MKCSLAFPVKRLGVFVGRKYTKETIGPKISKGCCLFLTFFSETTRTIGNRFGRNVHQNSFLFFVFY
jgi:hypothetical protein